MERINFGEAIELENVEEYLCFSKIEAVILGDLANFGPHPVQCVDILKKLNPICILGNHDEQIVSENPRNFWDKWSKRQLSDVQLRWMSEFEDSHVLDGHIYLRKRNINPKQSRI